MIYTPLTNKAMAIAYAAHQGQLDRCGQPYIFHPLHLAEQMADEESVCTALLHDVAEDTQVSLEDLEKEFPKEVMDALRLLTRSPETDYFEYIRAISRHPLARRVKLADLAHNSDRTRFAGCQIDDLEALALREEKYAKAKAILEQRDLKEGKETGGMKIALVTGASSGLGRAFARRLDKLGGLDEIWGVARRKERLTALGKELKTPFKALELDLSKRENLKRLRDELEREKPQIRILINAAGFGKFGTYADMTLEETAGMIDVNCRAAAFITAAAIPYMHRGSRILQICSSSSFQPLPGLNVYAATKAFILHYTRALRWEVASRGIGVTAVCPGWIKTEFMEVARDTKNGKTVRHFPFALRPETVARRALRNSPLMAVTTCGLPSLVQRIASKFLPNCLIMACWEGLRRI